MINMKNMNFKFPSPNQTIVVASDHKPWVGLKGIKQALRERFNDNILTTKS